MKKSNIKQIAEKYGFSEEDLDQSLLQEQRIRICRKVPNKNLLMAKCRPLVLFDILKKGKSPIIRWKSGKHKNSILMCLEYSKINKEKGKIKLTDGRRTLEKIIKDHDTEYELIVSPCELKWEENKPKRKTKKTYKDKINQELQLYDIVCAPHLIKVKRREYQLDMQVGKLISLGWPAGRIQVKDFKTCSINTCKPETCIKLDEDIKDSILKYKLSV